MSLVYPFQSQAVLPPVGASGSVLTSNGSSWVSAPAAVAVTATMPIDYNLIVYGNTNVMVHDTLLDSGSLSLTLLTGTHGSGVAPSLVANPDTSGLNAFNTVSLSASATGADGTDCGFLYIAGTDSGLTIGTGDFSFEAFIYLIDNTVPQFIIDTRNSGGGNAGFYVVANRDGSRNGKISFGTAGSVWIDNAVTTSLNTWHHIVVDRRNGQARIKVDGVTTYGPTSFTNDITNNGLYILGQIGLTEGFNGYANEIRLVIGDVVYGDNYVVPTASLTASGLPSPATAGQQIMGQAFIYSCLSGGLTPIWNRYYTS